MSHITFSTTLQPLPSATSLPPTQEPSITSSRFHTSTSPTSPTRQMTDRTVEPLSPSRWAPRAPGASPAPTSQPPSSAVASPSDTASDSHEEETGWKTALGIAGVVAAGALIIGGLYCLLPDGTPSPDKQAFLKWRNGAGPDWKDKIGPDWRNGNGPQWRDGVEPDWAKKIRERYDQGSSPAPSTTTEPSILRDDAENIWRDDGEKITWRDDAGTVDPTKWRDGQPPVRTPRLREPNKNLSVPALLLSGSQADLQHLQKAMAPGLCTLFKA